MRAVSTGAFDGGSVFIDGDWKPLLQAACWALREERRHRDPVEYRGGRRRAPASGATVRTALASGASRPSWAGWLRRSADSWRPGAAYLAAILS